MAHVNFGPNVFSLNGDLPVVGSAAPDFQLTDKDLGQKTLADFGTQQKVLNVFPSIDTPTCATSVRKFNERAGQLPDTVVLCVSADLPFAQARFCGAEGLDRVQTLSTFRNPEFLSDYGLQVADGPLTGLAARAVVVLDGDNQVRHVQLVPELSDEPDYAAALAALT